MNHFIPKTTDYTLSPYTGLTRQSWIEAAEYLLTGIFQNIRSFTDPVVMPRKETKVSYPHSAEAVWEHKAEYFEGLTRSFFIAAPVIAINPDIEICGYRLRDYYKAQVLRSCTPGDPVSVGTYGELQRLSGDTERSFQQTVETCALVICLWVCREQIWADYTKEERDLIAAFLDGFARGNTVPQNWRLFNMLDMAFLHMEGYPVDEEIMMDHAQSILAYYAGDGWYRDGHSFDYYSCWAFNVYAPIWNLWYGYEHAPLLAAAFEENSNRLMETYGDFFDRDGWTNMWGRSNIYRFAATSSFDGNLMLRNPATDPGVARRIASGSLLQFLSRDDFLYKGVPTLGFYGQFTPLVQGYSCAESPFWMGKAFLCLHLPEDHPFWTAKESLGSWEKLGQNEVKETVLDGPALAFTNHQANGETILRTGKVVKRMDDLHGMWNYSKLSFNTKYPWESTPTGKDTEPDSFLRETPESAAAEGFPAKISGGASVNAYAAESQQYVLTDLTQLRLASSEEEKARAVQQANVTFWHGLKDGVLYRRQFFNYRLEEECHWIQAVNLADFPVPYGILRADKLRLYRAPVVVTLGSYGFPDNGTEVIYREKDGAKAVILKGRDHCGREKQMAMTVWDSWDALDIVRSSGTNPDSENSIVIVARTHKDKRYGYGPYMLISQVITKESLEDFTEDELFPISEIRFSDEMKLAEKPAGTGQRAAAAAQGLRACGGYGPVSIILKDGSRREIDFAGIEGKLML